MLTRGEEGMGQRRAVIDGGNDVLEPECDIINAGNMPAVAKYIYEF